jgi:hypothetical protein
MPLALIRRLLASRQSGLSQNAMTASSSNGTGRSLAINFDCSQRASEPLDAARGRAVRRLPTLQIPVSLNWHPADQIDVVVVDFGPRSRAGKEMPLRRCSLAAPLERTACQSLLRTRSKQAWDSTSPVPRKVQG